MVSRHPGPPPVLRLAGPRALLVELADLATVRTFYAEAQRRRRDGRLPAVCDVVPAARTILFDGLDDPAGLAADLLSWRPPAQPAGPGRQVVVPTRYDGPDLAEVARCWEMTAAEVVAVHTGAVHEVAFLGFAPGFAYLTGLPAGRTVPRRPRPRSVVPAGAVGLADCYTGIYPRPSPGGWQLVGRTDLRLWDTDREPAALLTPGVRVRFVEVPG